MARKKVRFVASQDEKVREIFSVGEGGTGDLALLFRGSDHTYNINKYYKLDIENRLIEHRFSIHRSPRSENLGTTIIHTQRTEDEGTRSSAAYIKNSKSNLIWPIHSFLCPDLSPSRYDVSDGKTRNQIHLANDIPDGWSLIVHVVACSLQVAKLDMPFCRRISVEFENFYLSTYVCFANFSRCRFGASVTLSTTPIRINGKSAHPDLLPEGVSFDGVMPMSSDDLAAILVDFTNGLIERSVFLVKKSQPDLPSNAFDNGIFVSPQCPSG